MFALKIVAQTPISFCSQEPVCVQGFVLHGDVHVSFPDVILRGFKHKFAPTQSNLRWEGSSRVLSWDMGTVCEQKFSCWSCVLTEGASKHLLFSLFDGFCYIL